MGATAFEWINSGNNEPGYDAEKRRTIRVQAMKAAAASRKKMGTWGKHNMRQTEVIRYTSSKNNDSHESSSETYEDLDPPTKNSIVQRRCSIRARDACKSAQGHVIPIIRYLKSDGKPTTVRLGTSALSQFEQWNGRPARPMPLPGFEYMSAHVGVNVLDLDELTSVATGQLAGSLLRRDRTGLDKLIVRRRQSYLFHVPARYGHSPCLDDALRCIVTKAKRVLLPNCVPNGGVLDLYGKALRSLQAAVNDSGNWTDPNILGAIEMLSIYEILERPTQPDAWQNHIAGAGRMIRARGPASYKTDYEKALFASMVAPLTCEAIRLRQACFLEEEPWQAVLRTLIIDGAQYYAPRGAGYIIMWSTGTKLPGLMADMIAATRDPEAHTDEQLDNLEGRCRDLKDTLLRWRKDYENNRTIAPTYKEWSDDGDVRVELLGAGLIMLGAASRLLGAICPAERVFQEAEAVKYAKLMRQLVDDLIEGNRMESFYLEQKVIGADSILATSATWLRGLEDRQPAEGRTIEHFKFKAWCDGVWWAAP